MRTSGMPKCGAICSYGQNKALRARVWATNGPKTAKRGSEDIIFSSGLAGPNPVAFQSFSGRFPPKYAPRVPGFGHMNI